MEKNSNNQQSENEKKQSEEAKKLEGLPIETSPYVQYKDLEDYKQQGYGTQGHMEPKPGRGAGGTDAPTPSGGVSDGSATDVINRLGVP
ncbi:hypothetical protein BVRB_6g127730 [Beta vulgaris subsp. vulgaris]|uniref:uncharacterized protein LOC104894915 n=1 Tax=Beta vulgaris subsp. vulgaris TaxID=3555 RepID=UPI0005402F88|nr:uncharacterized protein LOC104894915 [Beta vulgaris subsp. vulgaris]KMT09793.1 hypothetical protein BVRB_6g127730 [Beta vulgaris subsp. vulgaris]